MRRTSAACALCLLAACGGPDATSETVSDAGETGTNESSGDGDGDSGDGDGDPGDGDGDSGDGDGDGDGDPVSDLPSETSDTGGSMTPQEIFGSRYWDVYRPAFLASFYEDGRVCDRIEAGTKMFGDNNIFMGYALSTFVFEYQAAQLDESLALIHEILDAYVALELLDGDPLDGYVYRSDRGPDYETNLWTRNNEPSGDQYLGTLRGLYDVVTCPMPLVHDGVDLKQLARERATWLGYELKVDSFRLRNVFGDLVKRGDDQRWAAWAFTKGCSNVSGLPQSTFEAPWLLGVWIDPMYHKPVTKQFIQGCFDFSVACVSGKQLDIGLGINVQVDCNEFNIGLGGDAAVISLSSDPNSPDWFSAWVPREAIISQGHSVYAMYARYKFNDSDPSLIPAAARFLDAPATPPTGDNLDPNGWCRSWRWGHDFDDPTLCTTNPAWLQTFSGLDYMLPRAFASAYGEFPE